MARITDYIQQYGNVSFDKLSFNQLDAAILTQLSLLDLSGVISDDKFITIKDAYSLYKSLNNDKERREELLIYRRINNLFKLIANKERYSNLLLSDYEEVITQDNPCQFSALSIHLGNKIMVSFGGTDDSVVGWHEDFLLLYLEEIPSHTLGLKYLNRIAKKYDSNFILCGHSKGANIAMNVTLWTNKSNNERIEKVYCFDGPGINKKTFDNEKLSDRISKITSYIPYKSSIGKLFDHYEKYEIVDCSANLVFQHDISTWHVDYVDFVYKDKESNDSIYLDNHIKRMVADLDQSSREIFVTSLFKILYVSEVGTYREASKKKKQIVQNIFKLTKEERKIFNRIIFKGMIKDPKILKMLVSILKERRKID